MYVLNKPKSLVSWMSTSSPNVDVPSPDASKAADVKAADEAARKLRAREKMRAGAGASLASGTTTGEFQGIGSGKKKLLGA